MKCGRLAVVMVLLGLFAAPAMAWDYFSVGVSYGHGHSYVYDEPVVVSEPVVVAPPVVSYVEPVTYVEPVVVERPIYSRTVIVDRPRVVTRAYSVGYYSPCRTSVFISSRHCSPHRSVYISRPGCHGGGHVRISRHH